MLIRNIEQKDYQRVQEIYAYARGFMKATGNPNQWKDSNPTNNLIEGDIANKTGYVMIDDGEIVGVFALIIGEDPTYSYIEAGHWLNDLPYGTIHRIASSGKVKGIFEKAVEYCFERIDNIRIDTHHDNKVMQHKILKNGFKYCGIIYVSDGSPRLAYQKTK